MPALGLPSGSGPLDGKSIPERAEECRQIAERASSQGALHYRFAVGDEFVLVNGEWDPAEAFRGFFGDPVMRAFVWNPGGDPSPLPEVSSGGAIGSPDQI